MLARDKDENGCLSFDEFLQAMPANIINISEDEHRSVTFTMRYAICIMLYAVCTMHYALCTMHYALCTMHYALCTMHYALCTMHAEIIRFQVVIYSVIEVVQRYIIHSKEVSAKL